MKFWWVIVLLTVVGAGGGFAYYQFGTTSEYAATARLFVTAEGGTSVGESYQNNLFAQERVNSYAAIATSDQVARRASSALGGAISPDDLRGATTAAAVPKTVILAVTVTNGAPRRAQSYANAVAQETAAVVQELETSRRGGAAAATAIVLDDADLPSTPTGYGWKILVAAGAFVGLLLGVLVSLAIAVLDRRIKTADTLTSEDGLHVLAEVPDSDAVAAPVVATSSSADLTAYRRLRTNLRFIGAAASGSSSAPRVVTVAGPGDGAGRTSVAVGLAVVLADAGHDVLLMDADLAAGTVGSAFGKSTTRGLSALIVGEDDLASSVVRIRDNLSILACGPHPPNPGELIASDGFEKTLRHARERFDHVIIDSPATDTSSDAVVCAALSDVAILVARANKTTRSSLRTSANALTSVGARVVGVALTHTKAPRAQKPGHTSDGDGAGGDENPPEKA
ncbi:MAG: polysaccharide biosynthesis tyrosine autokinase [Williamsia sp.]|nr:polysaccharide biosynthesis tyrosine autokinase [Williamsia sp.]